MYTLHFLKQQIKEIRVSFEKSFVLVRSLKDLEALQVKFLGKKAPLQELLLSLKHFSKEEKPQAGKELNLFKKELIVKFEEASSHFLLDEEKVRLEEESIDVTLPGRKESQGKEHLISQVLDRVLTVLSEMEFSVQYSPNIETDYYNFEALNFPPDHPARDMQDTFFINTEYLLRTHTSNTQVRIMEAFTPPIRVVAPGKCFRNETISARSHVMFHQVEGFAIDKGITFGDLISTVKEFLTKLLRCHVKIRIRPSYFPFVEPGLEVDMHCLLCKGQGCSICKDTGWLEVAGAGMIHPNVLISGGIDPEKYTGYAWGFGIERMVQIIHGVKDIRLFTENDLRFLSQF